MFALTYIHLRAASAGEMVAAEYVIRDAEQDYAEFIIALLRLDGGLLSPQIRCFGDGGTNLLAFIGKGGLGALAPVADVGEFEKRLELCGASKRPRGYPRDWRCPDCERNNAGETCGFCGWAL